MSNQLVDEINRIKKEMVVAFTKYSLSGEKDKSIDAILSSVLLTWFEPIESTLEFYAKYGAFRELEKMIHQNQLFELVEVITSSDDYFHAKQAVSLYERMTRTERYHTLSNACGYKLPTDFGNLDCYFNGTLKQQIDFYRRFSDRLEKIYEELKEEATKS